MKQLHTEITAIVGFKPLSHNLHIQFQFSESKKKKQNVTISFFFVSTSACTYFLSLFTLERIFVKEQAQASY